MKTPVEIEWEKEFDNRIKYDEFEMDCYSRLCIWSDLCHDCRPLDPKKLKQFLTEYGQAIKKEAVETILERVKEINDTAINGRSAEEVVSDFIRLECWLKTGDNVFITGFSKHRKP